MSHMTTVKSKISDLMLLKKTLQDLQISFTENSENQKVLLKLWNNETVERDDIVLNIDTGSPYNIGVIFNDETKTYEFVSDWWGVETYTKMKEEEFLNKIQQKYAYNSVLDKVREQGYDFIEEEVDEKNNIRLVVRKWDG